MSGIILFICLELLKAALTASRSVTLAIEDNQVMSSVATTEHLTAEGKTRFLHVALFVSHHITDESIVSFLSESWHIIAARKQLRFSFPSQIAHP
jgi:hypothetical protein